MIARRRGNCNSTVRPTHARRIGETQGCREQHDARQRPHDYEREPAAHENARRPARDIRYLICTIGSRTTNSITSAIEISANVAAACPNAP